ncbi:5703_t:CDS:2, partial [Diversispora eburnea]
MIDMNNLPLVITAIAIFAMAAPFIISKPKHSKRKRKINSKNKSNKTYVYGLVNRGNNVCFLNSVLQALASLNNLRSYLKKKVNFRGVQDEKCPVTIALHETLEKLNEPIKNRASLVPTKMVWALQENARRLINRQQQDAHELFQLLTESLGTEDEICRRPKSILDVDAIRELTKPDNQSNLIYESNPLKGLIACRISCLNCNYCGPIRHSTFDNVSIPLPTQPSITLETLLKTYSGVEFIDEYNCPRCSLLETLTVIEKELSKKHDKTKEHLRLLKKDREIIKTSLVADLDKDIDMELRLTELVHLKFPASKKTMFAKLPEVIAFHFPRSIFFQNGTVLKNPCRVIFPDIIDFSQIEGNEAYYRLKAVIVHLGDHRLGHFVTYRRQERSNVWWRLSDENIEESTILIQHSEVLSPLKWISDLMGSHQAQ